MKVQITTNDKKKHTVEIDVLSQQTEIMRFQMFLEHFKTAGYYLVNNNKGVLLYHTVTNIEVLSDV